MVFWSNFCLYLRNKVFFFFKYVISISAWWKLILKLTLLAFIVSITSWWSHSCLLKLTADRKPSNAAGWADMFQTFAHRTASVSSVKCTFIWLCTAECMSMLFSLLLLSDEPNRSTRGVVWFCLHSLRPGLAASPPRGQTQVVMIKAELLTPIPKNETAYCVATDSSHNAP